MSGSQKEIPTQAAKPPNLDDQQSSSRRNWQRSRDLEIQVKLGHEISFLTGTLKHGVKGSLFSMAQGARIDQCLNEDTKL